MNAALGPIAVVSEFPPAGGGIPVQAQAIVDGLRSESVPVRAVLVNLGTGALAQRLDRIPKLRTLLRWPVFMLRLLSAAPRSRIVHIVTGSGLSFFLFTTPAAVLGRFFGCKVLVNYHGGAAQEFLGRWPRFTRFVLGCADAVSVPSGFLAKAFRGLGYEPVVVANMVDLSRFAGPAQESVRPHFVAARLLEKLYNIPCILRAFVRVRKEYPDALLDVYGSGSEESALRAMAAELGLTGSVTFGGYVDNTRMPDCLRRASIFVNASDVDNFPVSILEAMAAGLPVVTTRAGGIPFILEEGKTGLMVDLNDDLALADRMLGLLRDPALAHSLIVNGRAEVQRYSWTTISVQLEKLYAGL